VAGDAFDAVVVGSGPNGLTAACALAERGYSVCVLELRDTVGGGTRTAELTVPGFLHDVCSAVHPLGASSPAFAELGLAAHGLRWLHARYPLAHPLDGGRAAVVERDLAATAAGLGADADAYRRTVGPTLRRFDAVAEQVLGPAWRPRHPLAALPFGLVAIRSAAHVAGRFRTPEGRALLAGVGSHSLLPLERPATASIAVVLLAAAHAVGWPFAAGGSASISSALRARLEAAGGEVRTGVHVREPDDLPPTKAVLLDVAPDQAASLLGTRAPPWYRRGLTGYRYGPGVCKLDLALDGPVPWAAAPCRDAGTVHVGGSFDEISAAERAVADGLHPERPFVIAAQPSVVDPSRAPAGKSVLWAYCHVPNGSDVDMSERILAQVERFAPGVTDRIVASNVMTARDLATYNPNYVGGDIAAGSTAGTQLVFRPMPDLTPYRTPVDGWFLCSSATPPGAGVHGMCGAHAAASAARWLGER
jgi:phytoene dehydrogenase-like protein